MTKTPPTQTRSSTFRLGDDLLQAMARLHERDGISPSEMARRALTAWLMEKGVYDKTPTGRTRPRRG
jgi:hypothetical protein